MPLSPDEITFDELEDDDQPEDIDNDGGTEDDITDSSREREEERQGDNDAETVDDIDDDQLEAAFNDATSSDDDTDEGEGEESQPENEGGNEEGEEEEEEARIVDEIATQFGLDPEEDFESRPDDTFDDVIEVAKKGAQSMAEREMDNFFTQYPDVAEYAQYRANGGDPDTFRQEVLNAPSYDELEIEGNENTQERIVREKLQEVDGFSDERVEQKVENYKSSGILKDEAQDAKDILSNRQEQKRQELVEKQEKKAKEQKEQVKQRQQEFRQTIQQSNDLAGLQISENHKDSFESYLFDPVDEEGMTQAEKDYQEMSDEEVLALYYLSYQGLDNLDELVDNKASTKRAENLSEKLKKSSSRNLKDKSQKGTGDRRKSNDASLEGFDLDQQIG